MGNGQTFVVEALNVVAHLRQVVLVGDELGSGHRRAITMYSPEEQREADALNVRIDAGDMSAYAALTRLAARVVTDGRWTR